jgi:hypothetical protein
VQVATTKFIDDNEALSTGLGGLTTSNMLLKHSFSQKWRMFLGCKRATTAEKTSTATYTRSHTGKH